MEIDAGVLQSADCFIARKQIQEFPLPSVYDGVTSEEKQWTEVILTHPKASGIAC